MIINQRKLNFLNFFKRLCVSERYIYNKSKNTDTFHMLFHDLKNRYIGRAVLHTNPMYVRHALVVVNHYKKSGRKACDSRSERSIKGVITEGILAVNFQLAQ